MNFVTPALRKLHTDFYIKLVNKAPALWGYLYHAPHNAAKDSSMQRLRWVGLGWIVDCMSRDSIPTMFDAPRARVAARK